MTKLRHFIETYIDWILLVVAFLLAGVIFWFFTDSTTVIADNFSKAISLPQTNSLGSEFDLKGAKKLDLRGFSQ